ncbi:GNAT family N-acetyltransferase [Pseudomonas sp. SP16.1]|uniref:GNAT family N-acetyltransferase n=1 Tax=Pseudomonas sp. SP16.1 TaxID=3458854 RepID=UPI00404663F4
MDEPRIASERLLLRPLCAEDAAQVARLAGDFRIAEVTRSIPHPYPPELAQRWIEQCARDWAAGSATCFAIVERAGGELIGSIALKDIARGEAEVGYWLGVPYWRRGYASEACNALVEFAFAHLQLRRLYASHLTRNPQSGRVLRKAGFRHLGAGHSECGCRGELEPVELYERVNGQ